MNDLPTPTEQRSQRISDPQRIRALTHPLRLELLDVLSDGPATATQCAALTGDSVASCSFHLRMLAKYGFIEAAARNGREKPWALTSPGRDIRPDDEDPESMRAVGAMAQVYVEHAAEQIRDWVAAAGNEPPEWNQASTLCGLSFWATAEELAEFSRTVQGLADQFFDREDDPSARPPTARPIRMFGAAHVDIRKEQRLARGAR